MTLVDPFGRHYDKGTLDWMRVGVSPERTFVLNCRHGRTVSREGSDESEGVILSRLIDEHQATVNASANSMTGHWLCFCEPHRRPE